MSEKEEVIKGLRDAVVNGDEDLAVSTANNALEKGMNPYDVLMEGGAEGMKIMSDKYDKREVYVPEIILSAAAMYKAFDILKPHIAVGEAGPPVKVVLGCVEGDIHDIGKNLVKAICIAAGFEVFDMGRDVPIPDLVDKCKTEDAQVLAMSTLMTTTLWGMKDAVIRLKDEGIKDKVKTLIGGSAVSEEFMIASENDGWGYDAVDGMVQIKEWFK
jgi:methanogenic corrinoid protein MtbC1